VVREVGKPVAGKTGTTNDEKDVWFVGFSPDLAVGVYVGYDKPKPLGRGATGGHISAPIVKEFLKVALADKAAVPFRVPAGIKLIRIEAKTGMRAGPGTTGGVILEAFKPGTAPPDSYSVIGYGGGYGDQPDPSGRPVSDLGRPGDGRPVGPPPESGGLFGRGGIFQPGGLFGRSPPGLY
jgi:penicillin-binding protein 1A